MTQAHRNEGWQAKVRNRLRDGYGVEDIAVMLGCDVGDVRKEVEILRNEGRLRKLFGAAGH